MTSRTDDRDIDGDPTVRILAPGTSFELHDSTRTELSSDVLGMLRILTSPAPREAPSPPRVVASAVRVAVIHPRPARTVGPMFFLAATLPIVTSAVGQLVAAGRRHAISGAKTLAALKAGWGAPVRRKANAVLAFFGPLLARWIGRASARVHAWRRVAQALDMSSLLRR